VVVSITETLSALEFTIKSVCGGIRVIAVGGVNEMYFRTTLLPLSGMTATDESSSTMRRPRVLTVSQHHHTVRINVSLDFRDGQIHSFHPAGIWRRRTIVHVVPQVVGCHQRVCHPVLTQGRRIERRLSFVVVRRETSPGFADSNEDACTFVSGPPDSGCTARRCFRIKPKIQLCFRIAGNVHFKISSRQRLREATPNSHFAAWGNKYLDHQGSGVAFRSITQSIAGLDSSPR